MNFTLMIKLDICEEEKNEFKRQLKYIQGKLDALVPKVNECFKDVREIDKYKEQSTKDYVLETKRKIELEHQQLIDKYNRIGIYDQIIDESQLKALYREFNANTSIAIEIHKKIKTLIDTIKQMRSMNTNISKCKEE